MIDILSRPEPKSRTFFVQLTRVLFVQLIRAINTRQRGTFSFARSVFRMCYNSAMMTLTFLLTVTYEKAMRLLSEAVILLYSCFRSGLLWQAAGMGLVTVMIFFLPCGFPGGLQGNAAAESGREASGREFCRCCWCCLRLCAEHF